MIAERFVATIGSRGRPRTTPGGLEPKSTRDGPGFVAGALVWEGSVVGIAVFADASERSGESPSDHVAGRS